MEVFLTIDDLKPEAVKKIKRLVVHICQQRINELVEKGVERERAEDIIADVNHGRVRVKVEL